MMDSQRAAKILVVGAGALGGLIAARLRASCHTVWIATKDAQTAAKLKAMGLHVSGVGGAVSVVMTEIAPLDAPPGKQRRSGAWLVGLRDPSGRKRLAHSDGETRREHCRKPLPGQRSNASPGLWGRPTGS